MRVDSITMVREGDGLIEEASAGRNMQGQGRRGREVQWIGVRGGSLRGGAGELWSLVGEGGI